MWYVKFYTAILAMVLVSIVVVLCFVDIVLMNTGHETILYRFFPQF
jgi:hypothetical protein